MGGGQVCRRWEMEDGRWGRTKRVRRGEEREGCCGLKSALRGGLCEW